MADGFVRSGLLRPDWTNNINTGLAGWWALREGCGVKASDISGKGNTGTLTSGPLWSGGGLKFDGTDDYVNAGTMGAFGSQIKNSSFFCVFRKTGTAFAGFSGTFNTGITTAIQCNVNRDQAGTTVAGKFQGFLRDTAGNTLSFANTTAVSPNDGEWHTLTIIFGVTGTTAAIIYDGQSLPLTYNNTGTVGASANFGFPLTLGALNIRGTIDFFFPGSIATARLWSRTLKIEEALRLHQNPNIGLWVPDTARYRATPAAGGADVRSRIIPAYMRIAA